MNLALREEIDRSSMFEEIVGSSECLRIVLSRVARVAPMDSTVLILGETGMGKELIARAIHKRSSRSGQAFILVCRIPARKDIVKAALLPFAFIPSVVSHAPSSPILLHPNRLRSPA